MVPPLKHSQLTLPPDLGLKSIDRLLPLSGLAFYSQPGQDISPMQFHNTACIRATLNSFLKGFFGNNHPMSRIQADIPILSALVDMPAE